MLRVISRPMTVPAERIALLNAGLAIIFSNMPGSAVPRDFTSPSALARPRVDRHRRRQRSVSGRQVRTWR